MSLSWDGLAQVIRRRFPWRDSFIAAPLLCMILNTILAALTSQVTTKENPALLDKGLRMMGLVANASISIVTLTFSLTVLSVQIAAQSYSPRLLDEFLKDPVSKVVISTNLGAYAYCYTINYFLDDTTALEPDVPYVAIHLLTMHMAIVLVTFVNFIHFFINGFRLEKILSRAEKSSLDAARALSEQVDTDGNGITEVPDVPKKAFKVLADESGYVTHYCLNKLLNLATNMDICVRYNHQIGEYVNRGTVLAYVWDAQTPTEDQNGNEEGGPPTKTSLKDRVKKYIPLDDQEVGGALCSLFVCSFAAPVLQRPFSPRMPVSLRCLRFGLPPPLLPSPSALGRRGPYRHHRVHTHSLKGKAPTRPLKSVLDSLFPAVSTSPPRETAIWTRLLGSNSFRMSRFEHFRQVSTILTLPSSAWMCLPHYWQHWPLWI